MATLDEIQKMTRELNRDQIGELAAFLLHQLHGEEADNPEQVKSEWDETISRRVGEIKDCTAKTIPGDQVMTEFREKFKIT